MAAKYRIGRVCAIHPDLNGRRFDSTGECPGCSGARRDKWRAVNRERELASARAYKVDNPVVIKRINNERNAQKKRATPAWANRIVMNAFYEYAAALRAIGEPCEVDHIVPLQHPLVCGLHCEHNMQIVLKKDNLKKGNRTWPDMPNSAIRP